ncbi:MAG: rane protein-like protein, partial [Solirubrobacterales bacterium]|nr:rane protein-like protein [Solirubrobacterales bacterium]
AAIVGSGAGGLIGHLKGGMSRSDLKDLGDTLDEGQAALIVIGESRVREQLEKELQRASKLIERQIDADAAALKQEIDKAAEHESSV